MKSTATRILTCLVTLLAACGDTPSEPVAPTLLSGSWTGTANGIVVHVSLAEVTESFTQSGLVVHYQTLVGGGSIKQGDGVPIAFTISGLHSQSILLINFGEDGPDYGQFHGTVNPDGSLSGTLDRTSNGATIGPLADVSGLAIVLRRD